MESYIFWTFMLAIAALVSAGIAVYVRAYLSGTSPTAILFRPKSERRLEIVEHANLDGRRKLVLIRRDDVEHLLLTGGPIDVVVETGIVGVQKRSEEQTSASVPAAPRRAPIFSRAGQNTESGGGTRDI